jgi:hypothetical protein
VFPQAAILVLVGLACFFLGCCVVLPAAAAACFGELAWRFLSAQADARLV